MTSNADDNDQVASLLLLLGRITFSEEERMFAEEKCRSLARWEVFTDLAIRHGIAALVWQNMTGLGLAAYVPEHERNIMEDIRFKTIARVSFVTAAATEAVRLLESEGIRVLLLKGAALEHYLYGSMGLRQMSDADLLVAPGEINRARDVLVNAGYVSDKMKSSLYRHILLDIGNHLPELHRGGISIDLHHRLFGPHGTDIVRGAMEHPVKITAGGRSFFTLPPRVAFLSLADHIFKHEIKGEFQLRLYTDIYLLLRRHEGEILDGKLMSDASSAGIQNEVRTVLTILNKFYRIDIPADCLVSDLTGSRCVATFRENLLDPGQAEPQSQKEMFLDNLRSLSGIRKKLIFITGDIFPSLEFMKRRYGCKTVLCALMHYPHRVGKIVWLIDNILPKHRQK